MWKGRRLRSETHSKIVKQSHSNLCPGPWRKLGTSMHVTYSNLALLYHEPGEIRTENAHRFL